MAPRLVTPTATMVMTAKQIREDRPAWLKARRFREGIGYCIGSSDTPAILGISFAKDQAGAPLKVWLEKVRGAETPDNDAMMWGRLHEDTIATYWRDRNRSVVQSVGLVSRVDAPWHQTTLDRRVIECPLNRSVRERCALEIKTRGAFGSRRWHAELPDDVLCQICHQLYVTGLDHIHYAVLIGGNDYHQGVVRADAEAETIDYVVRNVDTFRDTYLIPGAEVEPPWPVDASAQTLIDLDASLHPERIGEINVQEIGDVMELAEIRAQFARLAQREKQAKARLLRLADGAQIVTFAGELAYEFTPINRTKVVMDALAERYPAAYADPEVVVQTTSHALKIADAFKPSTAPADEES